MHPTIRCIWASCPKYNHEKMAPAIYKGGPFSVRTTISRQKTKGLARLNDKEKRREILHLSSFYWRAN